MCQLCIFILIFISIDTKTVNKFQISAIEHIQIPPDGFSAVEEDL